MVADTIKDLNRIAGIIALIFGVILIIVGVLTLIFLVGIVFLVFGIINLIIRSNLNEINRLIDKGEYKKAKEKQLVWAIIGFLLAGVIVGVIILIGYLKYDPLLKATETQ